MGVSQGMLMLQTKVASAEDPTHHRAVRAAFRGGYKAVEIFRPIAQLAGIVLAEVVIKRIAEQLPAWERSCWRLAFSYWAKAPAVCRII